MDAFTGNTMIAELRERLDRFLAERRGAAAAVKAEKAALAEAGDRLEASTEAQRILQETAEAVQTVAHRRISEVVTRCLEAVFEDPYTFSIKFVRARGKTDARLLFVRNGHELNPLTESGGGTVDIACLALKITCLKLVRPQRRMLLVIDEPFRGLSPEYHELVPPLLETLARELKLQMIMATNLPNVACGRIIKLDTTRGPS